MVKETTCHKLIFLQDRHFSFTVKVKNGTNQIYNHFNYSHSTPYPAVGLFAFSSSSFIFVNLEASDCLNVVINDSDLESLTFGESIAGLYVLTLIKCHVQMPKHTKICCVLIMSQQ